MIPSSAFQNYVLSQQKKKSKITINKLKQQYTQFDEVRLSYQNREKDEFERLLKQKQKEILKQYYLPDACIKEFKLKKMTFKDYLEQQSEMEANDQELQDSQKSQSQVVVRCSFDTDMLKALLKIHKFLVNLNIHDFQVYLAQGQAALLCFTIYTEDESINLWNDSVDIIQNDYNWLVETIQKRIRLHLFSYSKAIIYGFVFFSCASNIDYMLQTQRQGNQ